MNKYQELEALFKRCKHVDINSKKLEELAKKLSTLDSEYDQNSILDSDHNLSLNEKLQLAFVMNTQTFCFWSMPDDVKWSIEYDGEKYDGSVALAKCMIRSLDKSKDILDAKYLRNISDDEVEKFFNGEGDIPLINLRQQAFNEVGDVLGTKFDGKFINMIENSGYDALTLLNAIVCDFPYFNDRAYLGGERINFYKRAQLQVVMSHRILVNNGQSGLKNINKLVGCADYKIPQILRHYGVLVYSDELSDMVDNHEALDECSVHEVEIRLYMLVALKRISQSLSKCGKNIPPIFLDGILWKMSQDVEDMKPYHRTLTINY